VGLYHVVEGSIFAVGNVFGEFLVVFGNLIFISDSFVDRIVGVKPDKVVVPFAADLAAWEVAVVADVGGVAMNHDLPSASHLDKKRIGIDVKFCLRGVAKTGHGRADEKLVVAVG
jgi:hypothetical protein